MVKIGILGPVGSGKTTLIEYLAKTFSPYHRVAIITNDVVSNYDAERIYKDLVDSGVIPRENVIGIVTGGCPHTAIREDPSVNLRALQRLSKNSPDLILIESGGDNVMSTFSPSLADYTVYVLDTAAGDKYPRKGGLGIMESDLLVINKIDLAPYVGADLQKMREGAIYVRKGKPFVMVSLKTGEGLDEMVKVIRDDLGV
ncbi:urease accessory protein UreG [Sulfuracidifex tepidarius]|uniref:Hydrogenase nickel incorporation protein HypB n=1 Tax=Sulfuracidifex tepidarius TaxID=1294262 RepID=A0A510DY13_9CREN|nr:urease accessory protein UreG [Sulfuracidifex tepidarius]BBG25079.1 putative hydrogenase nickel incorporation protein HypB [Sulfuracidifex tepidarius]BBG27861.1 putative hydrogenase nickel incorporation protein HypB [Sulfuracidifex tepidarius]